MRRDLLLECDRQGSILWMNEAATNRLGPARNLIDALPEAVRGQAARWLGAAEEGALECAYRPAAGTEVPVRLRRLVTAGNTVSLLAEPRQRASDVRPAPDQALAETLQLNLRLSHHLFRLMGACRRIEDSTARRRADPGRWLTREVERERTRIAHNLHAGAGQTLAAIKINLELIQALMPGPPEDVAAALERIRLLTEEALGEVRVLSHRLHPPDWQRLRLREALEWLWRTSGVDARFQATLEIGSLSREPSHSIRIAVYRFCQEALSNAIRHSGAARIAVRVQERDGWIWVAVEDDGHGFDPDAILAGDGGPGPGYSGIGLRAIREQARALGGRVSVRSGSTGTSVEMLLPPSENP